HAARRPSRRRARGDACRYNTKDRSRPRRRRRPASWTFSGVSWNARPAAARPLAPWQACPFRNGRGSDFSARPSKQQGLTENRQHAVGDTAESSANLAHEGAGRLEIGLIRPARLDRRDGSRWRRRNQRPALVSEAARGIGGGHEIAPDGGRRAAARDAPRRAVIIIADPHADHEIGGESDEPCVAIILAGAGLARRRP